MTFIDTEILPFTTILFIFGGGCFLIGLKEKYWVETVLIHKKKGIDESTVKIIIKFGRIWSKTTQFSSTKVVYKP